MVSYVIPGNFGDAGTGNYLHYNREDIYTPISISQSVGVKESALLLEATRNLYSESTLSAVLDLDQDSKAYLGTLNPAVGEIISVKGIREVSDSVTEEYPIFDFSVNSNIRLKALPVCKACLFFL